jgi:hypothetical protein
MATKKKEVKKATASCKTNGCNTASGCSGAVYGLGFIASVIYYISTATGFWIGVLGVLKALIWPLFLIYEVLKFVGA